MASKTSTQAVAPANRIQAARRPITLELVAAICPSGKVAGRISETFGLDEVDFEDICAAHETALETMAKAFGSTLSEKAAAMHFERIVGALVNSAHGAAQFYTQKVSEARDLTSRLANEDRDEDRDGVAGFASKAERARKFAAMMGLQAYAQLAAAQGAVIAFRGITGDDWKPYVAPVENNRSVPRLAASAELEAFA
jgi:hypothetical protein